VFLVHVLAVEKPPLEIRIVIVQVITDIEQVLSEQKPFILHCMLDGIQRLQRRIVPWNKFASSVSIT
jgi:hypothetical protein